MQPLSPLTARLTLQRKIETLPLETPLSEAHLPPVLPSPAAISSTYRLLAVIEGISELRDSMVKTASVRLETLKHELEEASLQLMHKLKESAQAAQSHDFWSMLKKIANCLFSSLSALLGFSILGSGGSALAGGALLASGMLSLTHLILTESSGWDWVADQLAHDNEELKAKLLTYLPACVGLVAAGLGLAGSVYAVVSGGADFIQKVGGTAQSAVSLFSGSTQLGKGLSESRLTWASADLTHAEEGIKMQQEEYSRLSDEVNTTLEEFNRTFRSAKGALRTASQTQFQLTR